MKPGLADAAMQVVLELERASMLSLINVLFVSSPSASAMTVLFFSLLPHQGMTRSIVFFGWRAIGGKMAKRSMPKHTSDVALSLVIFWRLENRSSGQKPTV